MSDRVTIQYKMKKSVFVRNCKFEFKI